MLPGDSGNQDLEHFLKIYFNQLPKEPLGRRFLIHLASSYMSHYTDMYVL